MATENRTPLSLLRREQVQQRTGLARSTIYKMITVGEFTPPIKIFGKAVGWPSNEVDALYAARIAGKAEHEIRCLVARLKADRNQGSGDFHV